MAAGPYEVGGGRRRARAPRRPRPSSTGCARSPPSTRSWRCPTATSTPTRSTPPGWPTSSPAACPARRRAPRRTRPAARRRRGRGRARPPTDGDATAGTPRRRTTGAGAGSSPTPSTSSRAPTSPGPAGGLAARRDRWPTLQAGGVRAGRARHRTGLTDGDAGGRAPDSATAAARDQATTPDGPLDVARRRPHPRRASSARPSRRPAAPRLAEQRYLAELAVLTLQAPAGSEQTVLVAPPRDVDAGPEGAGAMMADTAGAALAAARRPSPSLFGGPAADAGDARRAPATPSCLDPAGLADVDRGRRRPRRPRRRRRRGRRTRAAGLRRRDLPRPRRSPGAATPRASAPPPPDLRSTHGPAAAAG